MIFSARLCLIYDEQFANQPAVLPRRENSHLHRSHWWNWPVSMWITCGGRCRYCLYSDSEWPQCGKFVEMSHWARSKVVDFWMQPYGPIFCALHLSRYLECGDLALGPLELCRRKSKAAFDWGYWWGSWACMIKIGFWVFKVIWTSVDISPDSLYQS